MPRMPLRLLILVAAFAFLIAIVQLNILTIAFDKLGLSAESASLLFVTILLGSLANIPLFSLKADIPEKNIPAVQFTGLYRFQLFPGRIVVAVNVGGCVVPVAFCAYLWLHNPLNISTVLLAVAAVTVVSYLATRQLPGIGLGMPIFLAPLIAAIVSLYLDPDMAASLAYISGTLGVLIGADFLHLKDIRGMGTPFASIGGAGSFDGVFLTGVVAALLA
jgi:uncharacterized membrane protein